MLQMKMSTHVQSAYKNPQKQKAAISISTMNCTIIARSERTIRLFFKVTNANLWSESAGPRKRMEGCIPRKHKTSN